MKFLKELLKRSETPVVENAVRLTNTQKAVLLSIYAAPTPELAYDTTTGAENVRQAAIQLRNFGMIHLDSENNRAGVTDEGQTALQNNSLIDDIGEVTEEGEEMLAFTTTAEEEFENAMESADYHRLARFIS